MASITLRSSLSRGLTNSEVDSNFTNLNNDKAENGANSDITSMSGVTGEIGDPTQIQFDPQSSHPAYSEGLLWYDTVHNTLNYYGDESGLVHEVGLEEQQKVYNNTASTISKGTPLYFSGNSNGYPTVAPANGTDVNKYNAQGLAAHDISASDYGYMTTSGLVEGIDTSGLNAGTNFFVGLTDGAVQNASPTYPNYPMCLGWVVASDATNGILLVNQQNHSVNSFRVRTDTHIGGDLIIDGDLTVVGSQTVASSTNIQTGAPFLYLNSGDTIGEANTTFTGSGLDDAYFTGHFSGTANTTYYVKIDGVASNQDTFAWSKDNFTTTEASGINITGSDQALDNGISIKFATVKQHTLNDVWSGTAAPLDVDTGVWSNRNTGGTGVGYTHVGMFFDVTDSKFKIVDEYDPEPTGTIDTADSSYSAGSLVVDGLEASSATVGGNSVLTTANEGSGNGIDADTVDGLEASQFLRSDTNDSASGQITLSGSTPLLFNNNAQGISYLAQENGSYANSRYFLRFDRTNNASYPYLTNRTPSGDVAIFTGGSTAGSENEIIRFKGGNGTRAIELTNSYIDMGTNDITDTKVGNWDTAYGWGDHASAGYLTSINIIDDTTPQLGGTLDANGNSIDMGTNTITDTKVGQWDDAYDNYVLFDDTVRISWDLGNELTYPIYYKVAEVNKGSGGLHIKGTLANHVESFGTQDFDLSIYGREANSGPNIEVSGQFNVATEGVGIKVVKATSGQTYERYDVYVVATRYTQGHVDLTKSGATTISSYSGTISSSSSGTTTSPTGYAVELDTSSSSYTEGFYSVINSAVQRLDANATTSANGLMSSSDKSKLDGIETGATGDQTASEILTLIKTVDGAGSGLDADTLDGATSGSFLRSNASDTFDANQTLTFGSGSRLAGGSGSLDGFFMPQNPEGKHIRNPFFFNDIAYARLRGATVTVDIDGTAMTSTSAIDNMLNANTDFWNFATSGATTVTITITNSPKNLFYGSYMGVTFGNTNWRAKDVTFEVFYNSQWNQIHSVTNQSEEFVIDNFSSGSTATSGFRWTFSNFNTTSMRIVSLFAYNYNSSGMEGLYVTRDGGTIYDGITVNGNIATTGTVDGRDVAADGSKLDGIATNAEVNQNAFANVAVSGQTTVSADSKTDTLTLAAGTGITLTTNASTDTVTIASSGGTDTNDYVDSVAFNTGSGVLTLGRTGSLADLTVDLDGRYATSDTNNYVSSASFDTSTGVLTLNRSGLSAVTVDLDDRYVPQTQPITTSSGTAFSLTDASVGKLIRTTSTSAVTITAPTDASFPNWEIGQSVDIAQYGAGGNVTISPATGVTVNGTPSLITRDQYSVITVMKVAANEYLVFGDLAVP